MIPRSSGSDILRMAMRCFDAGIAIGISWLAFFSMPSLAHREGIEYPLLIIVGGLLLPAVGEMFGLYRPWRGRSIFTMFGVYCLSWLMTVVVISVFLVATQSTHIFSRLWMGGASLGVLALGLLLRGGLYLYLRHLRSTGHNLKQVVVIGYAENLARIEQRLSEIPHVGYQLAMRIEVSDADSALKQAEALANDASFNRDFHEIWLSFPLAQGELVKTLAERLIIVPVDVRYFPDLTDIRLLNHRMTQVADLFSLDLNYSPLNGPSRLLKSLEDRVIGTLLFILFLPLMAGVACIVYLFMGRPILFKQHRHGLDGKRFRIYKFRTMSSFGAVTSTSQAQPSDPRVTRLGRWLRKTSLDELPQFYNVLQGRMSLVGPRPHAMDHNEYYKDVIAPYMQRHRVKPGITGWAQIHGLRGITADLNAMQKRIEYDLYYINNWSLGLDLKILLLTVPRGFINTQP